MDKVWLSTRYYHDVKFDDMPATTERMFSRLLALAGSLELGGKLPPKPWIFVGLPNGKRSTLDLVARGILEQLDDGTFEFSAWAGWQNKGDELAERKRADRERQRRRREREREQTEASSTVSRDKPVTVTPPDKRRGDKRRESKSLPSPTAARADTFGDGTPLPPEPDPPPTQGTLALVADYVPNEIEPARTRQPATRLPDGVHTLMRYHLPPGIPRTVLEQVGSEIAKLMRDRNVETVDIETALKMFGSRADAGPKLLPLLVADAVRARHGARIGRPAPRQSTTDDRVAQAQSLKRPEWELE